ncbi:hypothetical protein L6270_00960 [Candidatus Parcubacteria bacterium]|nr:hypothetical protein [Patescibacteria group bacterium]MBU4309718.1 hypothetical protein [Patescibacteria group bacterium]MBU4431658.1 hypothetical protein [Patescibacteria group bacterium]MBU4577894.1 hypothetical protein [Patescibacteria group bacterium]MCG2696596.1 hypothetical protein [Candidatus Parcubacteria bacterium]
MHFIFGIIIGAIGYTFVAMTEWYLSNFGRIEFFDKYLGMEGGSRLGYKLIGILAIFFGTIIFFGMWGGFLGWLLSPLIRHQI